MIELAERVAELSGIPDAKVFFTTSGSEANEAALLLAATVRRSNQVLALRNSYHGRSFADHGDHRQPGLVGVEPARRSRVLRAQRRPLPQSPFARSRRRRLRRAVVEDLRDVLRTTTAGDVAAMIAEPIQGVGGFIVPPDGLLGALQEVLPRARHPLDHRRGADRLGAHG